ncbi:MAG: pyridoxine 5'-phosphate synthase [Candidatus Cloacimonetes bacterium]|nr:pyridoxine 5'-phosphate synthase [Candidatus Cloacimonadota bacterium]
MRLGVNIDHIATLRQARRTVEPDPVHAVGLVERAGADGIVCHLREDRRHISDRDLQLLRATVVSHLNLEMAASDEMLRIALETAPDMVTLVPEKREEITTEGGLDVRAAGGRLKEQIAALKAHGIVTSLFVDPELDVLKECRRLDADVVELHTGRYANCNSERDAVVEADRLRDMALAARKFGLRVSAGHGLTYQNVARIAVIGEIEELNIGHSIISRAVFDGLGRAVADMVALVRNPGRS